ncbi:hypothetical protein [Nocardia miyunensis]|uniref:hypothetical protein n=1 Tax=Nocardia miyunensis TaxID=282684 RepID=UPI000832B1D6|nr:hypothetical protein [Nocardia miyunensis]
MTRPPIVSVQTDSPESATFADTAGRLIDDIPDERALTAAIRDELAAVPAAGFAPSAWAGGATE